MLPVLEKANDVLADENAMQDEVDEVYIELVKAFLDLRLKPNKDLLQELINQAEALNSVNYSAESWAVVADALNEAKAILDDSEASQEQVDNAKDVLTKGLAGLIGNSVIDNSAKTEDTITSIETGDSTSLLSSMAGLAAVSIMLAVNKKRKNK